MSPREKAPSLPKEKSRRTDDPVRAFVTAAEWARWLATHHASARGVWIRFFKKGSGVATVTYDEALDEALCWGWIDGRLEPFDDKSWLRRFTPRGPRSGWAGRNREHVDRLTREGRMKPPGLAQVAAAKADGRWNRAYDSPSASDVPADFLAALARHKKAEAFFNSLNKANRYAIAYRLQTAKKPETRARRFELLLQMMKEGKRLH